MQVASTDHAGIHILLSITGHLSESPFGARCETSSDVDTALCYHAFGLAALIPFVGTETVRQDVCSPCAACAVVVGRDADHGGLASCSQNHLSMSLSTLGVRS